MNRAEMYAAFEAGELSHEGRLWTSKTPEGDQLVELIADAVSKVTDGRYGMSAIPGVPHDARLLKALIDWMPDYEACWPDGDQLRLRLSEKDA